MSFLLSNFKELGFDGLVAVNGGCNSGSCNGGGYCYIACYSSGCSNLSSGGYSGTIICTKSQETNNIGKFFLGSNDKSGYWATLKPRY